MCFVPPLSRRIPPKSKFLHSGRTKRGQHQALARRWVQMHNHMPFIKRLASSVRALKISDRGALTRPHWLLPPASKFYCGLSLSALVALSIVLPIGLTRAHAQTYSGSSGDASHPSSQPSEGLRRPLSGTAPAPARPLSGFEQRGVSGIRPGQPGNPLPRAQSGGKDGKSGTSSSSNSMTPGQKANVQGQDAKQGDKSPKGKDGFSKSGFGKDANGNDANSKDSNGKDAMVGPGGSACLNCATILQVRTVRMKPNPSWMLNSDARAPETANSHNSDLPSRYQGSSIGTGANRSIIDPDGVGAQFTKRMYEVTLMMDSGLTRKIHLDMMPGYNLGSKVRVTGNRLLPR